MTKFISAISGNQYPLNEQVKSSTIRPSIKKFIQNEFPRLPEEFDISVEEMNLYREKYIQNIMEEQLGELSNLDRTVLKSINDQTLLSDDVDEDQSGDTLGQRVADKVASFGGSWTFIISFLFFLLCWIAFNTFWLANKGFDPYPFILLNLILSCLAALQAPVIMMSQNRQEEKDRERSKQDYMINLKSELEIRLLHEKIDHLIIHQQKELLEMQQIQMDMMNELMKHKS